MTDTDSDELLARQFVDHLRAVGLTDAVLHWDRSPWGARIPLTEERGEYQTPSLFVLIDGTRTDASGREVPQWIGALGGFDQDVDDTLQSVFIKFFHEQSLTELATTVNTFVTILKEGAK